jgi:hypothetical protein
VYFTLLGLPTITATVTPTGLFGELVSRLWDLPADGTATEQPRHG